MNAKEQENIKLIKQGLNMLPIDDYLYLTRDYLIMKGKIRNEYHFNNIVNDNTEWGITKHSGWSVRGADLIVRYFTHGKYNTLIDMIRSEC